MKPRPAERRPIRTLALVLLAVLVRPGAARSGPHADAALPGLEFLGRTVLPRDLETEGTRVGGLSGLAWDAASGRIWAVSDDRGQRGPVRLYRLRLDFASPSAEGAAPEPRVTIEGMQPLLDAKGKPFPPGTIDTEGIAIVPSGFLVSTEPIARRSVPAVIGEFGPDGRFRREVPLPARFRSTADLGPRDNLGFEGLATTPDGRFLFAGVENALAQDGPVADAGVPSPARLLRYDLANGGPPAEFAYVVGGVDPAPPSPNAFRVNGLSDLLPLGESRLVVLERQFIEGVGNGARLYDVSLGAADDVSGRESLGGPEPYRAAGKTLLVDLAESGVRLENYEGMCFGPDLPDGRRTLVIVSDDNFNPGQEATSFLVFAVQREPATIARIQGPGHRSPLAGRWLFDVEGVVTAVDRDTRSPGLTMESPRPDDDPSTSEGIFVAWPKAAELEPGTAVLVNGRVEELAQPRSLSVTRLRAGDVRRNPAGASLPPAVRLFTERRVPPVVDDDGLSRFEPASDALDFWESLEGMRVDLPGGTVVGPSSSRGDVVFRPDGAPDVLRTAAGGVVLPPSGPSLDRALLGRRLLSAMPDVDVGARLEGPLHGIADYAFGNYRVWLTAPPAVEKAGAGCDVRASLRGDRRHLTIATFNVENLSVAGPAERFARIGEAIAARLGGPDVLALEEVQDDSGPAGKGDGVVTSERTLAALVAGIASAGGPRYGAVWIDPVEGREGGQPGGNIRVALLLNPERVTLVRRGAAGPLDATEPEGKGRDLHLTLSPGRVAPGSAAFTPTEGEGVRRSLAVELRFRGKPVFLVANHWSSKTDDDRPFGGTQPPRTPTTARRLAQAREIRAFVERLLAADPGARVVVVGDLNDFEHSDPVRAFAAPPLENLVLRVPPDKRYTFNFEGASQVLDHVVVTPALARDAAIEILHVNSDCSDGKRTSDHDPILARLRPR